MKTIWFHMQGYRDLPDDFRDRYESIWVTPPTDELCDSATVGKCLNWNLDELELADDLGFDGLGLNEHHQNGYGFPVSPNLIAANLARRVKAETLILWGKQDTLTPPVYAEEFAARITGAQVQLIDSAGHVPQLEQREVVSQSVLQFLTAGNRKTSQVNGV